MSYLYQQIVSKAYKLLFSICILLVLSQETFSQLVFKNASLEQGDGKAVGSIYRFPKVTAGVDALVTIDSLINNSSLVLIDETGFGYEDAFQPKIQSGGNGISYIVFTIKFVHENTSTSFFMGSVTATNLDLDGNSNLKELCEFDMKGGSATFMSNTPEINVSVADSKYLGMNVSGVEYTGIDTSAQAVMFKVHNLNINEFKVRIGASVKNNSQGARQYSVYLKDFQIANASTLPVTLTDFQANLKDKRAFLVWTTANQFNFSHFEIEKSTDGRNFYEAAVLFAEETASTSTDYKYEDNLQNSISKVVFYRLKMVDVTEKYAYSETRMVRLATEQNTVKISTFPNPVTSEVRIVVPAEWQEKAVTYEIFSNTGLLVQRIQTKKAGQVQQMNVQNLNSGNYIVKVSNGIATSTSKIIKVN